MPPLFSSLPFWFFLPYQIYFRICGIGVSERLPLITKEFVVASHFPFTSLLSIWFFLPYQILFASRAIFCCDSLDDTRHFILQQWNSKYFYMVRTFRRGPLCWCKNLVLINHSAFPRFPSVVHIFHQIHWALGSFQWLLRCQETCWVLMLNVLGQWSSPQSLGWNAWVSVWPSCPAGWPALPNSSSCSVPWRSSTNSTRHWPRAKAGCCRIVSQGCHDVWVQSWVICTCMFLSVCLLIKFHCFKLRQYGNCCQNYVLFMHTEWKILPLLYVYDDMF